MFQPLFVRSLTEDEKKQLATRAESLNREEARRAGVVLLSSQGKTASDIARSLGFHPSNVKKWVRKFNEEGLAGLAIRKRGPREGPRPSFTRDQIDRLLDLASTTPSQVGYSFERWTAQKLANAAVKEGIVDKISHVTVQQILKRKAVTTPSIRDVVREGTHSDNGLVQSGRAALRSSQFDQAVTLFQEALAAPTVSGEEEAELRILLSQSLEELSRYEDSFKAVEKLEYPHVLMTFSPGLRARVKLRIGWTHSWLRDHPKAIASLNDAKKLFLELQDEAGISEANYALGRTYIGLSEFRIARDHLITAINALRSAYEPELLARIYFQLGTVDFYEGSVAKAKECYLKALNLAENSSNSNLKGMILLNLGMSFSYDDPAGRAESVQYSQKAILLLEASGHKDFLALAYNNLGENHRLAGLWDQASDVLNKAIEIALRFSQPTHEATAKGTLAEILSSRGRLAEAESHATTAIELASANSDRWLESYVRRVLASVYLATDRDEEALSSLRHALRISTAVGDLEGITLAQVALAEAHYSQGGLDQAREYLELAQGRLREEKSKPLYITGLIQRLLGMLEAAGGRYAIGRQHVAQSISIFTTTEIPFEVGRSQDAMGQMLALAGEPNAAEAHFSQARAIFEELRAQPWVDSVMKALAWLDSAAVNGEPPGSAPRRLTPVPGTGGAGSGLADRLDTLGSGLLDGSGGSVDYRIHTAGNDILLMQRLIEASASRELLINELCSVVYENFDADYAAVLKAGGNRKPEVLASQGIATQELRLLLSELDPSLVEAGAASGAYFAILASIGGDSAGATNRTPALVLYIHARSGDFPSMDQTRLQPLIKQVELGLETCALRDSASIPAPDRSDYQTRTITPGFIVGSALMFEVVEKIHKIRTSDVTVLITGESGTGKELVARALHAESARARAIFLPFNCTATPRDLIESQLFGHRRGAFTGATTNYPGMVRAAEGGTLFLDEIGDVALEVQPKLMRFLQEGEIQPLGETRPVKVDVRVVAATNSDLERAVEEGRFREDLFHRLNIIRIHVPPLRERREEIPALASFFLDHFASRSGKPRLTLTQEAMDSLTEYQWPGNVRQLRNEIERVTAYASDGARVSADDLTPEIANGSKRFSQRRPASRAGGAGNNHNAAEFAMPSSTSNPGNSAYQSNRAGSPIKLKDAVADLESRLIKDALARNRNNVSKTAFELGLSRRGLRLKLAQLGIDREYP
jgi:DNA-binding NtrC family response regulator/tetratricopeptide (TPR) repeat protein/transposase